MLILAIDTSCDETSVAVTDGRKILANEIYSQILIHKKWGGVVPSLAKRAHEERIDYVIKESLRKFYLTSKNLLVSKLASRPELRSGAGVLARLAASNRGGLARSFAQTSTNGANFASFMMKTFDYVAVTYGPGLAVALEVGVGKAKELAEKYNKKIIPVNHMEGHIYSCFAQNRNGNPKREFNFPYLALLVSGGHTELVIFKDHINYQILGETVDDAAGEALDKAAKMLGLGYPGGPIIETLAEIGDQHYHKFPRPLIRSKNLNFSFSGLKTSFFYYIKNLKEEERIKNLNDLVSSYQEAIFETLIIKLEQAINKTRIKNIIAAGGVLANLSLRKKIRRLVKKHKGQVLFPPFKNVYGDNAAMIGIAAYYKTKKGVFVKDLKKLDRVPRLSL